MNEARKAYFKAYAKANRAKRAAATKRWREVNRARYNELQRVNNERRRRALGMEARQKGAKQGSTASQSVKSPKKGLKRPVIGLLEPPSPPKPAPTPRQQARLGLLRERLQALKQRKLGSNE